MKIKIEYDYYDGYYRAITWVGDGAIVALSEISFDEAKKDLIDKIKKNKLSETPPEPEEIEI